MSIWSSHRLPLSEVRVHLDTATSPERGHSCPQQRPRQEWLKNIGKSVGARGSLRTGMSALRWQYQDALAKSQLRSRQGWPIRRFGQDMCKHRMQRLSCMTDRAGGDLFRSAFGHELPTLIAGFRAKIDDPVG